MSPDTCRPEIRKWTAGSQADVKIKASRRRDGCHGWTEQCGEGSTFFSRVSEVHQVMTAVSLIDDSDLFFLFSLFLRGGAKHVHNLGLR